MDNTVQRERKVNLEQFPREEADRILGEISARVANMVNATKDEINALLKIYGYEASFVVNFHDLKSGNKQEVKPKKGRPKKVK